ncbi:DUF881 domain-containing protein [Streptomyces sp. 549]|uniref:DUF881 domain-containing protein n=1 Tax=Streptomyces sp. 549 TaxID=3049076 RepID=UPI0024C43926|nr:DUF881 domain-containing protein [Streptomyces sp. 549]MDK1474461.1 DUF881 domain-containing protein [Streptomyces sp. 549]
MSEHRNPPEGGDAPRRDGDGPDRGGARPGRPAGEAPAAGPGRDRPAVEPGTSARAGDAAPGRSRTADTASRPTAGAAPGKAAADSEPADGSEGGAGEAQGEPDALTGRQRLVAGLWPPRVNRKQLVAALLLFVLGLGLAIQVRSTSEDSALRGARQEDLVRILGEMDDRTTRLEDEKRRLEGQRSELENSSDQAEEARKQTREREQQLGVLAGTVGAEGPGIQLEIADPAGAVKADQLLNAIQELRAAGAEAIQINDVRVVARTYFTDAGGGVRIDGRRVTAPYRFEVIGQPQDLEPALNIPGGVVQTLQKEQATVEISRSEKIVVDALRSAKRPDYAQSSSQ